MSAHTLSPHEKSIIEPRINELMALRQRTDEKQSAVADLLRIVYPNFDAKTCRYEDGVIIDNRELDAENTERKPGNDEIDGEERGD